jgi:quinol monooxygenase YgiN
MRPTKPGYEASNRSDRRKEVPIAALVTMTPRPGCEDELLAGLTEVVADVRTEPGNLMVLLLRDPDQPDKIFEFTIFQDQAAIEAHRKAEHSLTKGPLLSALQSEPWHTRFFETLDWPASQVNGYPANRELGRAGRSWGRNQPMSQESFPASCSSAGNGRNPIVASPI